MDLSQTMQESLLTLLCMNNESACIIRNVLPAASFEGIYGDIARAVYPYIDKYKRAPKANLDDVLDDILSKENKKARRVGRAMHMIKRTHEGKLNAEHVMSRLDKRLRYFRIKTATRELLGLFNTGVEDDEAIDQMEGILNQAARDRVETFDPGIRLGDKKRAINSLLRDDSEDVFPTGIKELDQYNLGPKRKTLHILIGLKKVGKTRWLVQLAQHAAMQGARVLHVSLEMDEERMLKRYYQSFFAIAQKRTEIRRSKFKKDDFGRLTRVAYKKAKVRLALDDKRIRKELGKRIDRFGRRLNNIIIKSFPTRQLTFNQLVAYIDRLEIQERFVPDLLIIDYPKLMRIDMNNFRLSLGALLEDLRGLGVERNMAIATVAQSHRVSKGQVGLIDTSDIGEDFSQTQTLDVGLVYRQTKMEATLGLARIYVDDARDVSSGWEVLIAQNYSMGQFCVDSIRMRENYWGLISKKAGLDNEDGEET